jgi:hypothetical protein
MTEQKQTKISRREMIKAAGLVSLGLLYTKPFVETIHAKSAFEGYDRGGEGLTPGFWKQAHHFDRWVGYSPDDKYGDLFSVDSSFGNLTLLQVLKQGGGGEKALGRHSVAALLNASNKEINYLYDVKGVIAEVQGAYEAAANEAAAYKASVYETLKDRLAEQNELGYGE